MLRHHARRLKKGTVINGIEHKCCTVEMEELFNKIYVSQKHAATAVSSQAKRIQCLAKEKISKNPDLKLVKIYPSV